MTPELPRDLVDRIRRACQDADEVALQIGQTLACARKRVGFEQWPALLAACGLPGDLAERYLLAAQDPERNGAAVRDAIVVEPTVICGWCERTRADRGLPPKHVSGPAQSPQVVHGVCEQCDRALDRKLAPLRSPPPPLPVLPPEEPSSDVDRVGAEGCRPLGVEDWDHVRIRVRTAFFHIDRANEALHALKRLQNPALHDGAEGAVEQMADVLERLTAFAAEMVLMEEWVNGGKDYDDAPFESEHRP